MNNYKLGYDILSHLSNNSQFYTSFFFAVLGIEPRGVLPPRYTPGPIFYTLF